MAETNNLTPMLQQYWTAKKSIGKDYLLLFRLGDFYELFYEDAIKGAKMLEITLTQRGEVPMCGVPAHAADNYIKKLLALGQKVAICEQTSPVQKGSIVQREVVEKITPGTITNSTYLDSKAANFLGALSVIKNQLVCAWIDISTTDLYVEKKEFSEENVRMFFGKIRLREVLYPESLYEELKINILTKEFSISCTSQSDWNFSADEGARILKELLGIETLKSFDLEDDSIELSAIAALLHYTNARSKNFSIKLSGLRVLSDKNYLCIDADAIYNLELFSSMREQNKQFSLYGVLDRCNTAVGSRMLADWLAFPSVDTQIICARHEKVALLLEQNDLRTRMQYLLDSMIDMPRIMSKIAYNKAHPKDMAGLRDSLSMSIQIYELIISSSQKIFSEQFMSLFEKMSKDESGRVNSKGDNSGALNSHLGKGNHHKNNSLIEEIRSYLDMLEKSLVQVPSIQFGSGEIIAQGYDEKLDKLRNLCNNQRHILNNYVAEEQKNVPYTLKLKFNNVLGYFFDTSASNRAQSPEHFILRQTLTKQDRYKTEQLIMLETEILEATQSLTSYEESVFNDIRSRAKHYAHATKNLSDSLAELDIYLSFCSIALQHNYTKPRIHTENSIKIIGGRHPVIESSMLQGEFVANDVFLKKEESFVMLTGPNMSGKSTYLRQNALIVIMAQIGSFVPAKEASIGIRDKVFCRVGASDNLVKGESTFLVEMSETAYILQQATTQSMVIMDEIGRGTSVTDGEAIAQAVAEYFIAQKIFTLFATHYHDLTDLNFCNMKNYTMSLEKNQDSIIFTRHIKEGALKNSYGIEVAKMAGVPDPILTRARTLLKDHTIFRQQLDHVSEENVETPKSQGTELAHSSESEVLPFVSSILGAEEQTEIVSKMPISEMPAHIKKIIADIKALTINELTPIASLQYLEEYQRIINAEDSQK